MILLPNSANPMCKTVHGFLQLLLSQLTALQGSNSVPPVGTAACFHLDCVHLLLPPANCSALAILYFRVLSVPSHVPKEEKSEAAEPQPPKPQPQRQGLANPGDLDAIVKPRMRPLCLTTHRHCSQVRQTVTCLQASPPRQARLLRCQPRGRANR